MSKQNESTMTSAEIAAQTEAFLKSGGSVEQVPAKKIKVRNPAR